MRETFASRDAALLVRSPNLRQQAARRRMLAVCGVAALAIVSGLVGAVASPGPVAVGRPETGPFSYFPSE